MQEFLKPLRVVFAVVTLLLIGFMFIDFADILPSGWFRNLLWMQFVPSLIHFAETIKHGLTLSAFGFVAVLLLTLFFGRVYCSYLCPLGVFQDVVTRLTGRFRRKKGKKFRYRFAPPKSWLRYTILIVVGLSLFTGSIFLVDVLDPYSVFGRIASDFVRPLYVAANNALDVLVEKIGIYALYPVNIVRADPYALIIPSLLLILVVWMSARRGRLYCNAICPVGTLLGFLSKASLFKIRIDDKKCTQCGKCMHVCKSQCIDVKQQQVDFSRCVACGNCIGQCASAGIRYSLSSGKKTKMSPDRSKRKFLFGSLLFMGALSGLSVKSLARSARAQGTDAAKDEKPKTGVSNESAVKRSHVCPPGAQSIAHFNDACTACHLCVSACPSNVLKPSLFEWGFFGMMQPYMDYSGGFCNYECVKCTEVCPSHAIMPLTTEQKVQTQIGKVRFILENCIVHTEDTSCGSCSEHCPTKAVKMVPYIKDGVKQGELTIPQVNTDICVGCGACEYACPVRPNKAILVDGCEVHGIAQKPPEEKLNEKPMEDFPF